jgi:hypothetical protein
MLSILQWRAKGEGQGFGKRKVDRRKLPATGPLIPVQRSVPISIVDLVAVPAAEDTQYGTPQSSSMWGNQLPTRLPNTQWESNQIRKHDESGWEERILAAVKPPKANANSKRNMWGVATTKK